MNKKWYVFFLVACSAVLSAYAFSVSGFTPDEYVVYKSIDGVDLKLEVFKPEGHQPSDNRPAILFFFGGGWSSGDPSQFHPHCEYLAERGIVAMSAEYRISGTHGTTPAECVMDGKSAMRWIRNHAGELGIDPDKLAAGGGSAGGHVAAAVAALSGFNEAGEDLSTSCIPDALVLFNPVVDNGPDGYGYDRVQAYWEDFSPLHNIHSNMPPTSFYLGTNDKIIPVSVGAAFQAGMEALGLRCDLHLYDGRNHGFFNYGETDYAETVAEMDRFLVSLGYLQAAPTKLVAVGGDNSVSLNWDDSVGGDVDTYSVYRSTTSGSYGSALVTGLTLSEYTDNSAVNDITYYYVVTAVDTNANESAQSVEVSATPEDIPDVYVNDQFDFGTDSGKVTPTSVGFTHFVAGGQTITDVADAVRFISAIGSGPNDFATLKTYNDLVGSRADFNITMEAKLVTSSDGEPLRSRYGIAMFNNSSDLHETGLNALLYYHDGKINMYIRNGTDGAILTEQLFKDIGGSETYTFEVTGAYSGTDLDLVFSVTDGTITKSLNLTVNPESYPGTLFGCATRMRNGFTVDFDRFSVSAGTDSDAPVPPTGLTARAGDGQVTLDWDGNTEPDLGSYSIYRSTMSSNYTDALVTGLSATNYVDSSVTNDITYYYVITAVDTNSNESAESSEVSATPFVPDAIAPASPTGLAATAGDGSVSLDWADNSEGDLDGYKVYRSTTSSNYPVDALATVTSSDYVDDPAENGTTYYYAIAAFDTSSNESGKSIEDSATPTDLPPAAPTGLDATAGDGRVSLVWNANSEGDLAGYSVYRSTISSNYTAALTNGLSSTQFVDHTVSNDTTYYYSVSATDANSNESVKSDEASATPAPSGVTPQLVLTELYSGDLAGDPVNSYNLTEWGQEDWNFWGDGNLTPQYSKLGGTAIGTVSYTPGTGGGTFSQGLSGKNPFYTWAAADETGGTGATSSDKKSILKSAGTTGTNDTFSFTVDASTSQSVLYVVIGAQRAAVTISGSLAGTTNQSDEYVNFNNNPNMSLYKFVYTADNEDDALTVTIKKTSNDGDNNGYVFIQSAAVSLASGGYEQWAFSHGVGAATNDFDADGLNNLYEYAMNGNPTNPAVRGTLPTFTKSGSSFIYVHPKRTDDTSLIYTVETTTNLISGAWTNQGYTVTGTNVTGETLDFVTNDVDTVQNEKFIRLRIGQ